MSRERFWSAVPSPIALALVAVAALAGANRVAAQGCVASRLDAPLGAAQSCGGGADKWEVRFSWRYYQSDRHFTGDHEDKERKKEHTEVINTIHLASVGLHRQINERWSIEAGIPWLMATRSSAISKAGVPFDRSTVHSNGIGDITVVGRRAMLDPDEHPNANFIMGFGMKFPTGETSVQDTRRFYDAKTDSILTDVRTVDQSIQPGDGGIGAILEMIGYVRSKGGHATFQASGSYLFNPEGTDHVLTYRGRPTEKYMSIADQFAARIGGTFTGPGWNGCSIGIGTRVEGIPTYDLIGTSRHFRRPGIAVALEPSFGWQGKKNSLDVSVPWAVYRNRFKSWSDKQLDPDGHGDAAYADWQLLVSWGYRFGGSVGGAQHSMPPAVATPGRG